MPVVPTNPLAISDFILVNAATNTDITSLVNNPCNGCIGPTDPINVRVTVVGEATSVMMSLNGPVSHEQTEGVAPYALFGDDSGNYHEHQLMIGDYSIFAQALDENGKSGPSRIVHFSVSA